MHNPIDYYVNLQVHNDFGNFLFKIIEATTAAETEVTTTAELKTAVIAGNKYKK